MERAAMMQTAFSAWLERRGVFADLVILSVLAALLVFPALGQMHKLASREMRHVEIIREMAASRDYLVPRLLGNVYIDKPPVMHAVAALFTQWWGKPSVFLARLPSALAAILTVWLTYGLGRVMMDRQSALMGGVALLAMPGFAIMARQARPDMILCFSIVACSLALALGMKNARNVIRTLWFILAGAAAGLGTITKGPYGLLFPVLFAVLGPIRRPDWRRPRIGWVGFVAGMVAVAAVWAVPAYLRDGGRYLHDVVFQKDLDVATMTSQPWYNTAAAGIVRSLPLILFLPLAIVNWRRNGFSAPLACAAAILLVVMAVPTKRPHYLVPMYPFLAMGLAATIVQRAPGSRSIRRSAWVLTSLGLVAIPLYHCTILPAVEPGEDPDLRTARAVMTAMEPGNTVYSVSGLGEPLAWLGGDRYQTKQLGVDDAAERMRGASPGSYVVVASDLNEKFLDVAKEMSLKHVGTFPRPRRKEDLGTHPARSVLLYHF